jgi:hypothetical protein
MLWGGGRIREGREGDLGRHGVGEVRGEDEEVSK